MGNIEHRHDAFGNDCPACNAAEDRPRSLGRAIADASRGGEEIDSLRQQLAGAVDLVEQARGCVTAALNCTAHPWHGDDRARKWLMDADRLGGQ
jgi:hypothetical protein